MKAMFGWKKTLGILSLLASAAIVFAACGEDEDEATPAPAAVTAPAPAAATAAPAAATAVPEAMERQIGAELIGSLEGPTVITDPSLWPKTFNEAPMLAELVRQGQLPPVDQRVPNEPLVVSPVHEIGEYGGG